MNTQEVEPINSNQEKKPKFQFPHVFIILFGLMVIMGIASYFIPAGEFERTTDEDGTTVVVEGTYHQVESNPTGFFDLFLALPEGMSQAAGIIFFILIVGGSFSILIETKALDELISSISLKMSNKEIYMIPAVMLLFALGGATFGMAEETIPFMLVIIPLAIRMGFDSMVGAAMVLVGAFSGFTAAFLNPFTVGVAQTIAELPMFSGLGFRIAMWVVFVGVSIAYVMFYARKVKKNPEKSLMYKEDQKRQISEKVDQEPITVRQILIITVLIATLIGLALGVIFLDWYIQEIAALFIIMGIVVGLIGKMRLNQLAENFVKGCEGIVLGALVVGFAYGILVVLQDSRTIDTILYSLSNMVSGLPAGMTAIGMFVTQSVLNFIVPSGSGQAALTMPIMAPLADLVDVSRQTAVIAFQMGDGISNIITPTSGAFMAALAVSRVPWVKWLKWIWPLILIQYALGALFVTIAHLFVW
ncbi:uncharacterized protein JNUCC1_00815 [Lentibacillus sp. JNUCC-1]|uniref:YfcC family protein n=1 Tax=Lentibacillus sp. JNUCC-1 TaxID=2654513 RepID=UPI0013298234|nr:YfcC family protein [Lentibacillus sp. JNUCC-1]MUV37009.1 uncharacterized protein [Lentibacillus sp. JNUCC-1]